MKLILWNHRQYFDIPRNLLKLVRPNHPNNCLTLDLVELEDVHIQEIKGLWIKFQNGTNVKILIEDRKAMVKRSPKLNKFESSGHEMYLDGNLKPVFKYFAVKLHQHIFVPNDPSVDCVEYPTQTFKNFDECDSDFTLRTLGKYFPTHFIPIWTVDNMESVTKQILFDDEHLNRAHMIIYTDLMAGTTISDCLLPCTKTKIETVAVDEKYVVYKDSKIDISFTKMVTVSKTDFPEFSIVNFLSALGGSMGFWLGLGVIQTLELLMKISCSSKMISSNYK